MITKAYNLRQADVAIIEALAEGDRSNYSAALRRIISDWTGLQPLVILGQACALGMVTAPDALEQLITFVSELPVPYQVTEVGENAAIASS